MSCSVAIALLCLDLSGVYIDSSLSALDSGVEMYAIETSQFVIERGGVTEIGWSQQRSFAHQALNPYGRLAFGYEHKFFVPELRLSAELYHESSLATGRDRGVNGARISLRWYPFGSAL